MRPARFEDREGILDIDRNLLGGLDYMPTMLDIIIHHPNIYPYVAVSGEEIVSMSLLKLI